MSLVYNIAYRKKKKVEPDDLTKVFYFESTAPFSVTTVGAYTGTSFPNIEYSLDNEVWSDFHWGDETNRIIASCTNNNGGKIYFRGTGNTALAEPLESGTGANEISFVLTGTQIACHGNVEVLLDYITVNAGNHPQMTMTCFFKLFADNTNLISAPTLPATTLTDYCYNSMFSGCTGLITAPDLPATTLAQGCYGAMFLGCTDLRNAPDLPAMILTDNCYAQMFRNCTSLVNIPALPATTLAYGCYGNMFQACTGLITAPDLPATTLAEACYLAMFQGCTNLITVPDLPATTLAQNCYGGMFQGCTSLTSAPELPAMTLAVNCYQIMFGECTSLVSAPALPATELATQCYNAMFYKCSSITTPPVLPATTLADYCYTAMFRECTSLTVAPELPATELTTNCYNAMFYDCTSLTIAPELPAMVLSESCYYGMFWGCTSLVTVPTILPATTLVTKCYSDMFRNCVSLIIASALPSMKLVERGYERMFFGCTSLRTIPALPATTIANYCYANMFSGCSNVGLYQTASDENNIPYKMPYQGATPALIPSSSYTNMFAGTAGDVSAHPGNTVYYVYSVIEPDGTILTSEPLTHIYGASWDGTSTTKWTRTDEAANFADPVPYVSGATEYSSPFDGLYPWKDMTIVEDDDAGTMVKIPKFWYKLTQNGTGMLIQIANKAVEGYSVCPACMDRGDGNGERDYILIGRYHCANSIYKSKTGELPLVNVTCPDFRTGIQSLGTGIYMADFATRFTIWLLYLVEFADWNSQVTLGYGCGDKRSVQKMGYTDAMPYHTGTTQSSRSSYGLGTQYRHIEGLWDNVFDWTDGGCYKNNELYIILNPSQFSDLNSGIMVNPYMYGNYPSAFTIKNIAGTYSLFVPTAFNGDQTTYSCDTWSTISSVGYILVGGTYSAADHMGLFHVTANNNAYDGYGSRPMKLPNFTNN